MGVRWEYKVVKMSANLWTSTGLPEDLNVKFDEYGAEGWELVSTDTLERSGFFSHGSDTAVLVAFFKRRVRP
jgi:hypothetical protein